MNHALQRIAGKKCLWLAIVAVFSMAFSCQAVTVHVIGQVESVYLQRASMLILDVPGDASGTSPLKIGQKISFMLPALAKKNRGKEAIAFGKVIEAELEGSPITEYGSEQASAAADLEKGGSVFVWMANKVSKVKNPKKYLGENGKEGDKKKGKGKKGKNDEPEKVWTQEETVRGKVFVKNRRLYIKEDFLRPRDLGLDVLNDDWYEKLKPYNGQVVVIHGTTRRVSAASGTVDVGNLIKIYPPDEKKKK